MTDMTASDKPLTPNEVTMNLGALRSSMSLTLHTYHTVRLWHGRARTENTHPIIGLNGFLIFTNKMAWGAAQDDPYSDLWLLRIEQKLNTVQQYQDNFNEHLKAVFESIPPMMSVSENLSQQPVTMPIFARSPLGFRAVYLMAGCDEIIRRLFLARHIALLDTVTSQQYVDDCGHQMRSLFTLAQKFRFSGCTRDDFAANNARAMDAIEKFGPMPPEILSATVRSKYAPMIRKAPTVTAITSENDSPEEPAISSLSPVTSSYFATNAGANLSDDENETDEASEDEGMEDDDERI